MKDDSRKINKGDIFISLTDNDEYIIDAINRGASKIICSKGKYKVETINVSNPRKYLADYLDKLYKDRFDKVKLIGITGTNGKTTSCYLLWQILNKLGYKCGYIGTIGFYIENKIRDLNNTTPDMIDLYNMIDECINNGCKYIVMEVSSQALSYGRIGNLKFNYAIFTNLTVDHLDYHKTMEEYAKAKQELFKRVKEYAVINIDSDYYNYFLLDNKNITYGVNKSDYMISDIGDTFKVNGVVYKTNLIGKYNIYNLLISIIILDKENIKYDKNMFNSLKYPNGRMEMVKYKDNMIIVDYAHTPDAVKNVIDTLKELKHNRIITIIGCGGDRDNTKRSKMGYIVSNESDYVILTNDNPRTENEMSIINDIIQGIDTLNYEILLDREKAIRKGIQTLSKNDILLVLGKGHEDYQIIGNNKFHFSDMEVILKFIKE